jgi:hypothetical protein
MKTMKGGLQGFSFFFEPPGFPKAGRHHSPRAVFFCSHRSTSEKTMDQIQKQALQVAKEIVVKFIEVGRISPSNFSEYFEPIYDDVYRTVTKSGPAPATDKDASVEPA